MVYRKKVMWLTFLLSLSVLATFSVPVLSANRGGTKAKLAKTTSFPSVGFFNGNRIYSIMENTGRIVANQGNNAAMWWPSFASGKTINFASGMWVGGKVNHVPVTACAEYSSEWAPGNVLLPGLTPDNPFDLKYKLYKINKADALDPKSNPDWMNWPVDQGAPWIDNNKNGVYEPLAGDTPALLGDQMVWYVMNDLDVTYHGTFKSAAIGLQCKVTVWGYNRPDEFGDMMFAKFQLNNVKQTTVDSCYLGIWADIDIGDGNDDFVACDTTLSLGYTYNDGADGIYGAAAPAIGYDFFQGAIVASPGDTAKAFGKRIPDYKNLGMAAFVKYINTTIHSDPYADPETAQEAWNLMSGLGRFGQRFVNTATGLEDYPVRYGSGDPVTGTGWLDKMDHPSGDRRQLITCGPFTLAPGDSQEVVTACIIGQGTDALSSITQLKIADKKAQTAYDLDFALPKSPPPPIVKGDGLDGDIMLTWDGAAEEYEAEDKVDIDPDGNPTFYSFQGYNVYQLETNQGTGAVKKIATFDLNDGITDIKDFEFVGALGETVEHSVQNGKDTGVQRYIMISSDKLRDAPLVNNRPYYFAVTAYGYNPAGIPKTLESPKVLVTAYPQQDPGVRANNTIATGNDSVFAISHTGPSQGAVKVTVINPTEITGHDYKVVFYTISDTNSVHMGEIAWKLVDTTLGKDVLADQIHQGSDAQFSVVDGIMTQVSGPAPGMLACVETANPTYNPLPSSEWDASGTPYQGNNVWWSLSCPDDLNHNGKFLMSYQGAAFYDNLSSAHDFEIRWTATGSWANYGLTTGNWVKAPFELWDIGFNTPNDPSDDVQMFLCLYENGGTPDLWDIPNGGEVEVHWGFPCSDRIYMYYVDQPGKTYADLAAACDAGNFDAANAMWGNTIRTFIRIVVARNDGGTGDPTTGTVVRFVTNKPNSAADTFTFSTAGYQPEASTDLAKQDIAKINVFPNPYFGANVEELKTLEHFVRFTHLPSKATLRIFTLAGELVRTLNHDNNTQFETWNLENFANIPVASGMYIVHVDCGTLGQKVLKLALIMAEERMRQF